MSVTAITSAGTYNYTDCVVCIPVGPSDSYTYTSVEPVHPIYTDGYENRIIIQTQAVALGGFNGLNN
jgi:hypothetical protein